MNTKQNGDLGFVYKIDKSGGVTITHYGKYATRLRGRAGTKRAVQLEDLSFKEQQLLMAKLTGKYKSGNEKDSKMKADDRRCTIITVSQKLGKAG